MPLKVDYVAKETGRNLIRNPLLCLATVAIVTVAVGLVGSSLLIRQAVGNATARWQGGVEFIVFMNPDAVPEQIDAVERALAENPQVEEFRYLDEQAAYQEYLDFFAEDSPELVAAVTPEDLPTNFKVTPVDPDPDIVNSLLAQFQAQAGVYSVVAATEAIQAIDSGTNIISLGMLSLAVVLTGAALLFIGFTIQTAVYARRREIEVMKLVGATNWFIRVPFMLEGVIQGVIGALGGIGLVYLVNSRLDRVGNSDLSLFSNFEVAGGDVLTMAVVLLVATILFTAVASAIAVSFYVNV